MGVAGSDRSRRSWVAIAFRYAAAHAGLGVLLGVAWGALIWVWEMMAGSGDRISGFVGYVPAPLLCAGAVLLGRRHRSAWVTVVGAGLGAASLVATQVGAVRVIDGPIEEIGTGGAMILGMLFFGLPAFLSAAIIGGLAAWGAGRVERRRRAGCCIACGYSLAGLSSGVCPECGRAEAA